MENAFDTMRAAVAEAEHVNQAANEQAGAMARIIRGRLRHVSSYTLCELKRELRDFNIHTGQWKP